MQWMGTSTTSEIGDGLLPTPGRSNTRRHFERKADGSAAPVPEPSRALSRPDRRSPVAP